MNRKISSISFAYLFFVVYVCRLDDFYLLTIFLMETFWLFCLGTLYANM